MDNSVQLLKIFQAGFTVFLVLAILFLILSIVLFIKFDIRGIWQIKSGRAQSRAIREKQEEAAMSGKIRNTRRPAPELKRSGQLNTTGNITQRTSPGMTTDNRGRPTTGPIATERTYITPPATPQMQPTSEQLREGTNLTTALKPEERQAGSGKFVVEKQIIYIHTEELI